MKTVRDGLEEKKNVKKKSVYSAIVYYTQKLLREE